MSRITTILTLILCLNINIMAKNTIVWENPASLYSNESSLNVSSVCFSDTATVVKLLATRPQNNIRFVSDTYLLGDSGKKYLVRSCNEYPLDRYMPVAKKENVIITLVFDPMPRRQKSIDLVEGYGYSNFKILGIHKEDRPLKIKAYSHQDNALDDLRKSYYTSDSVCVKGRFEKVPKERTGIIYYSDVFTDKDCPITVSVNEDGSFERKFKVEHPVTNSIFMGNSFIPFFVRPGHTVDITIHENGSVDYKDECGNEALCAKYLQSPIYGIRIFNSRDLQKDIKSSTFKEFSAKIEKKAGELEALTDYLAARLSFSSADYELARTSLQVDCIRNLFEYDFTWRRHGKDTTRLAELRILENYSLLKKLPVNDPIILTTSGYRFLQNRYSYMTPIMETGVYKKEDGSYAVRDYSQRLASIVSVDSSLFEQNGQSLLAKVYILNDFQRCLDDGGYSERKGMAYNAVKTILDDQALLANVDGMYKHYLETKDFTYVLPDGAATRSLRKITDRFKGRYVFIDFWSTGCGPCRFNIERTIEERRRLRSSPDVAFVFITSEGESPSRVYTDYVAEHLADDYCYRVSNEEYFAYRELFKFNGIPHYEVLDRQGNVIRFDSQWYYNESLNKMLEKIKAKLEK